jgi:hypothetical protein
VVCAITRGSGGELWPSLIYAFYWLGNQSSVVNTGTTAHEDKSVQRGLREIIGKPLEIASDAFKAVTIDILRDTV